MAHAEGGRGGGPEGEKAAAEKAAVAWLQAEAERRNTAPLSPQSQWHGGDAENVAVAWLRAEAERRSSAPMSPQSWWHGGQAVEGRRRRFTGSGTRRWRRGRRASIRWDEDDHHGGEVDHGGEDRHGGGKDGEYGGAVDHSRSLLVGVSLCPRHLDSKKNVLSHACAKCTQEQVRRIGGDASFKLTFILGGSSQAINIDKQLEAKVDDLLKRAFAGPSEPASSEAKAELAELMANPGGTIADESREATAKLEQLWLEQNRPALDKPEANTTVVHVAWGDAYSSVKDMWPNTKAKLIKVLLDGLELSEDEGGSRFCLRPKPLAADGSTPESERKVQECAEVLFKAANNYVVQKAQHKPQAGSVLRSLMYLLDEAPVLHAQKASGNGQFAYPSSPDALAWWFQLGQLASEIEKLPPGHVFNAAEFFAVPPCTCDPAPAAAPGDAGGAKSPESAPELQKTRAVLESLAKDKHFKRDKLLAIERKAQERWEEHKSFELSAPPDGAAKADETYFVTFPFPYMNEKLHLGHALTLTKAEFAVGYQRMKGKKCLWPMGFHCTGMPIKAAADKIKKEIAEFGNPPQFPAATGGDGGSDVAAANHTKLATKSAGKRYQWETMEAMGLATNEIAAFADPEHWLRCFPQLAIQDLKAFGLKIDFRRSFITTPANPFFDSFVRWQFTLLKEKDKIRFGKRYTVYSPVDGQPCMDHDRSKGEGAWPQEYTGIKMQVLDPKPPPLATLPAGKNVFLVAATLRPETMYGQTNCWVSPTITYVAFAVNDTDVYVTTRRAARNIAHQPWDEHGKNGVKDFTRPFGEVEVLCEVPGRDLMGCKIKAPEAQYDFVYCLPLMTIQEDKGTGVLTCVPSDAPDDWAGLRDLQKKTILRGKYNIAEEMVLPFEPVPIIDIPEYGDLCAIRACDELKVQSQNDKAKLAEAKELCYNKGFYEGKMKVGKHAGKSVQAAKELCRADMFADGTAVKYYEPEKQVVSRSEDECVVGLCDQWYLVYGEPEWRAQVEKHVMERMETFDPMTKEAFMRTLDWLHEHACSRQYGLGSRLPWDEEWLIGSLSDSTIYMAYYAVAGLLHGGTLDGSGGGSLGIKAEQLTRAAWDFIYLGTLVPEGACDIPQEKLDALRNEFLYLYPMDLRVAGSDLVPNHLTYCLYNHAAIFPEEMWPRGIRANGPLMLNNNKMLKSTGNFLTLEDSTRLFSADVTRMCLAEAGDSLDDVNFEFKVAYAMIVTLHKELEWTEATIKELDTLRAGPLDLFADRAFLSAINQAIADTAEHYDKTMYREAQNAGWSKLQIARNHYREMANATGHGMHRDLIARFIRTQWLLVAPFTPHLSEHIWELLYNGEQGLIVNAPFPEPGQIDTAVAAAAAYVTHNVHRFRVRLQNLGKKKGKKAPTAATIYVASVYAEWQRVTLAYLESVYDAASNDFPDNRALRPELRKIPELQDKKVFKGVMPFISWVREAMKETGHSALSSVLPFDEVQVLQENKAYLDKALGVAVTISDVTQCTEEEVVEGCKPGEPGIVFA